MPGAPPYPAAPDFHLKVKRLTMICASLALLQIMFAVHRFAQGATAPAALRVADCRSAAMLIKSALRDLLSVSYDIVCTTAISHLRWLSPLWCLTAPPSRPAGKRVTCHRGAVGLWMLSHGAMSLQESIERFILPLCTSCIGCASQSK